MRLQATIVLGSADAFDVEGLLLQNLDDYFTDVEVYQDGRDVVVEVYSESEDAGDQTADFLEDNGYNIVEYILE
jgi:hypothetical protein|tara:strand:- start:27 stop:248 length:222 start_codon:yes stop_codon:yes gene_type:complete